MHPFPQETERLLQILQTAHDEVEVIETPELAALTGKIRNDLKRNISALSLQLGLEVAPAVTPVAESGPLTKVMGRPVNQGAQEFAGAETQTVQLKTAEQVEADELRVTRDELYPRFLSTPTDDLLDSVSEIEIRAVAKKAGLPVTEQNPARITPAFVDQVKAAIQNQINLKQMGDGEDQTNDIPHTITAEDLNNNPDLVGQVEVGEEIGLGPQVNEDGTPLSEIPAVDSANLTQTADAPLPQQSTSAKSETRNRNKR